MICFSDPEAFADLLVNRIQAVAYSHREACQKQPDVRNAVLGSKSIFIYSLEQPAVRFRRFGQTVNEKG